MFDLCWILTTMKIIVILNLHQQFLWPSLVAIEHCLLYNIFNLFWPLTSMKVIILKNLHWRFFCQCLVAIEHSLLSLTCWSLTSTKVIIIIIISLHQWFFWPNMVATAHNLPHLTPLVTGELGHPIHVIRIKQIIPYLPTKSEINQPIHSHVTVNQKRLTFSSHTSYIHPDIHPYRRCLFHIPISELVRQGQQPYIIFFMWVIYNTYHSSSNNYTSQFVIILIKIPDFLQDVVWGAICTSLISLLCDLVHRAVGTATAGTALAVPLFSLKKGKKKKLLMNNFVIIVPSTCCKNSNLFSKKP